MRDRELLQVAAALAAHWERLDHEAAEALLATVGDEDMRGLADRLAFVAGLCSRLGGMNPGALARSIAADV